MPMSMPLACQFISRLTHILSAGLALSLLVLLASCDQQGATKPQDQTPGQGATPNTQAHPTIVSLTPAVTQMLIDMGKRDHIIGVSTVDDPALGLPTCGTFTDPIVAQILDLEPQLVITESPRGDGKDVPALLRIAADRGAFKLVVLPHSRSIADVERTLTDATIGLGKAVDDEQAAQRAVELMSARLDLIHAAIKSERQPRVLMLIEPSTLGALGPGATHDEMLRLAGGTNAIAELKTDYLKLSIAQIEQTIRPDVILIFEPGGQPIQKGDTRLRALKDLSVPAVTQQRIVVIDHPGAMLPSTASPAVVAQMAKAIHPHRADAIDQAYEMAKRLVGKPAKKEKDGDDAGAAEATPGGGS